MNRETMHRGSLLLAVLLTIGSPADSRAATAAVPGDPAPQPVAWVDIRSGRLTMVVNSVGYWELPLPAAAVSQRTDGEQALSMPIPSRNFLPALLTGSAAPDDAGVPPGARRSIEGGMAWTNEPVAVEYRFDKSFPKPGHFGLIFSAYVRGTGPEPVPVELGLDWRSAAPGTNAAAVARGTVHGEWERLSVRLPLEVYELKGEAVVSIGGAAPVDVTGLQLEPWGDYPVFQQTPTAWMPGETVRHTRPPTLPAWPIPMDWGEGAVALKVRIVGADSEAVSGDRTILFVGGFWQGVIELQVHRAWVGGTTVQLPTLRQILADGQEHALLLAWDREEVRVYADGEALGRSPVKEARPAEDRMGYQLWIGTHNPRKRHVGGQIRALRFYDRPVAPDEVAAESPDPGPWMEPPARYVFRRDEEDVSIDLPLHGEIPADVTAALTGLPDAAADVVREGGGAAVRIRLQPWKYAAGSLDGAILLGRSGGTMKRWPWAVQIVAAEARDRYPVGNWGSPGTVTDLEWARELGLGTIDSRNHGADYLNLVALHGLRSSVNFGNMRRDPHPATPEHLELARLDADRLVQAVRPFPWVTTCIHNSEGHGTDDVALSPAALASLKRDLGLDAPLWPPQAGFADLAVRPKVDLRAFAETGIVPDDHLPLRYVRWLMTEGDGMNLFSRVLADRMRAAAPRVQMVQEPASERYAEWADTLSNWRYANRPAPMLTKWRMGLAAAQGTGKRYYPLTGHCYFSPAIHLGDDKKTAVPPSGDMAAAFLWTGLAMPAGEARCFGWWQKDWEANEKLRPGSSARIKAAIAEVSRLGPVVGDVPLRAAPLAVLIPAANVLGRAHEEWWHAYNGLVYAAVSGFGEHDLQADVIYERQVLAGALRDYRYLYIPGLRYQQTAVNAAVQAWRQGGGQLILDNLASPAFEADLVAPVAADEQKGMAIALDDVRTEAWVREFRQRVQPYARVEEGQAIVLTKERPGTRFVVAINNRWRDAKLGQDVAGLDVGSDIADEMREFKDGGKVRPLSARLEDVGVAHTIDLSLLESPDAAVFDLRAGRRLEAKPGADDRLRVRLSLEPGDAAVLAIYPRAPARLVLDAPRDARPGQISELGIRLLGEDGLPLPGRQGVRLEVSDAAGERTDASAVYRLEDGQTQVRLRLPLDAAVGTWRVQGQELASSLRAEAEVAVERR